MFTLIILNNLIHIADNTKGGLHKHWVMTYITH